MIVANISVPQMRDRLDVAANGDELSGREDAIAHVGWIINGYPRAENLEEIQADILNPANSSYHYINGYTHAWKELYALLF